jgi:hypothetical protein
LKKYICIAFIESILVVRLDAYYSKAFLARSEASIPIRILRKESGTTMNTVESLLKFNIEIELPAMDSRGLIQYCYSL